VFSYDGLVVDLAARNVSREGKEIRLTATEWAILAPPHPPCRDAFSRTPRSSAKSGDRMPPSIAEYLRVYFTHLRKKIEKVPSQPTLITNEPGVDTDAPRPRNKDCYRKNDACQFLFARNASILPVRPLSGGRSSSIGGGRRCRWRSRGFPGRRRL